MNRTFAAALAAGLLAIASSTSAHRLDEYLQATLLSIDADRVAGSMRLVPGELMAPKVIADIDSDQDGSFSESEQQAYARRVLDDQAMTVDASTVGLKLLSWDFPAAAEIRAGLGEVHIEYTAPLPDGRGEHALVLSNSHMSAQSVYLVNVLVPQDVAVQVTAQRRNQEQSRYELGYRLTLGAVAVSGTYWSGIDAWWDGLALARLFKLGMHHIGEGTDHLLFLLAMLLPAPLLAANRRWGPAGDARRTMLRVLGIVTAFTVGHSVILFLAVMGGWTVPGKPVEVLIALSILVSAVHALRPLFPGREAWVAASFGLVHGLAFASTLDRLGMGVWNRVAGTLAFNAGIEAMQLVAIAAVLPTLLLLSRSPGYLWMRTGGALLGSAAAVAWLVERLFDVATPVDAIAKACAQAAPLIAAASLALSLALRIRHARGR
jgi:hypothetical protein